MFISERYLNEAGKGRREEIAKAIVGFKVTPAEEIQKLKLEIRKKYDPLINKAPTLQAKNDIIRRANKEVDVKVDLIGLEGEKHHTVAKSAKHRDEAVARRAEGMNKKPLAQKVEEEKSKEEPKTPSSNDAGFERAKSQYADVMKDPQVKSTMDQASKTISQNDKPKVEPPVTPPPKVEPSPVTPKSSAFKKAGQSVAKHWKTAAIATAGVAAIGGGAALLMRRKRLAAARAACMSKYPNNPTARQACLNAVK